MFYFPRLQEGSLLLCAGIGDTELARHQSKAGASGPEPLPPPLPAAAAALLPRPAATAAAAEALPPSPAAAAVLPLPAAAATAGEQQDLDFSPGHRDESGKDAAAEAAHSDSIGQNHRRRRLFSLDAEDHKPDTAAAAAAGIALTQAGAKEQGAGASAGPEAAANSTDEPDVGVLGHMQLLSTQAAASDRGSMLPPSNEGPNGLSATAATLGAALDLGWIVLPQSRITFERCSVTEPPPPQQLSILNSKPVAILAVRCLFEVTHLYSQLTIKDPEALQRFVGLCYNQFLKRNPDVRDALQVSPGLHWDA